MKDEQKQQQKEKLVCMGIIAVSTCVAMFVRLYQLNSVPYGIHADESGMAYDAWCLAYYQVDRWLNHLPVYLMNYGGGQSALYAWLCAILIRLTGGSVSLLIIRLPGAIVNLAAFGAGIAILKKVLGLRWAAAGSCILAMLPYFIMQCRFALDCNLLVNMLTITLFFFLLAVEKKKSSLFILAGVFWGLTYYTYALSYVENTLLLAFISLYLLWSDRSLWKKILLMWIPVCLLGMPLALMILINKLELPQFQLFWFTIPRIIYYRGGEFTFGLKNILGNVGVALSTILANDGLPYNAFDTYYTMYGVSIPFVFIGFFALWKECQESIKKKVFYPGTLVLLLFCIYFLCGICLEKPNVNRLNGIFFAQFFLVLFGIRCVYQSIRCHWKAVGRGFLALLSGIYVFSFLSFAHYYFVRYPKEVYPQWLFYNTYADILEQLEDEGITDREIYIDSNYSYFCLSALPSPYEYNCREYDVNFWGNYRFYLPDEYVPGAVYIVTETNTDFIGKISPYVQERCRGEEGMYICYYE